MRGVGEGKEGLGGGPCHSRVQIDSALGVQGPTTTWVASGGAAGQRGLSCSGSLGWGQISKVQFCPGPMRTCPVLCNCSSGLGESPRGGVPGPSPAPGAHPVRLGIASPPSAGRGRRTNVYPMPAGACCFCIISFNVSVDPSIHSLSFIQHMGPPAPGVRLSLSVFRRLLLIPLQGPHQSWGWGHSQDTSQSPGRFQCRSLLFQEDCPDCPPPDQALWAPGSHSTAPPCPSSSSPSCYQRTHCSVHPSISF